MAKLDASGALVWATYLGSADDDYAASIAVDAAGSVFVAGNTFSVDFPTTPGAFAASAPGNQDGFVTKLNPTGTGLVYSTFLGGTGLDYPTTMAIDAGGNAFVTGVT